MLTHAAGAVVTQALVDQRDKDLSVVIRALWLWLGSSIATLFLWALSVPAGDGWMRAWGVIGVVTHALMVGGACYTLGALLGFLFGIPKTLVGGHGVTTLAQNTNLEQVSDWLTKILVGVGLTQLGKLNEGLPKIGEYFAVANRPSATLAIILNWGVAGFLVGYLLTRLFFVGAFAQAEVFLQATGRTEVEPPASELAVSDAGSRQPQPADKPL